MSFWRTLIPVRMLSRNSLRGWGLVVAALLAGCQTLETTSFPELPTVTREEPTTDAVAESPVVDPSLVDDFRKWLDQDAWQVDVAWSVMEPRGDCPSRPWRWIFQPTESPSMPGDKPAKAVAETHWQWLWHGDLAKVNDADRSAAKAVLETCQSEPGRIGHNATILLARLDQYSTDGLRSICEAGGPSVQVIRTGAGIDSAPTIKPHGPRTPIPTRCAAAETWCRQLAAGESDENRLHPVGKLLQTPGLPDELRGTLWRSLATSLPPDRLPGLSDTCTGLDQANSTNLVIQRAALEACVIAAARLHRTDSTSTHADELWPPAIDRARRHADPQIRRRYGRWLALSAHPEMLAVLNAQRNDTEAAVREAAIISLGLSTRPEAKETLESLARQGADRDRATAVEALSVWGAETIQPFVAAETPVVRMAVARGLTTSPNAISDRLLRQLLTDRHPDVQATALATARTWPVDWAVPALLEAVRGSSLAVRQQAATAIRELTHEDILVPIDGLPEVRDAAVREWAMARGWRIGGVAGEDVASSPVTMDDSQIAEALAAVLLSPSAPVESDAWDRLLTQARPKDITAIERALIDSRSPATETVRRELLPRLDESYAALRDLSEPDIRRRREAARRLNTQARQRTLSPVLLRSLHAVLVIEQDQIVWQQCLEAVQADGHAEAAQLALLAVHHTWPDVRRLGVAYLALHPTPEAAGWLLPLFRDESRKVQEAAIAAAAKCGNPIVLDGYPSEGSGGLRSLLPAADHELRWTILETMASLHDDQAAAELIRLSYDSHPRVREQSARTMGATGDSRFVEILIRWSWTESADVVKQTILASLDTLTPPEDRPETPSGLAAPPTIDDKIKQWAAWWEHHAPRSNAAQSRPGAPESRPTT